jgi:cytochrome c oxidase subunit 2
MRVPPDGTAIARGHGRSAAMRSRLFGVVVIAMFGVTFWGDARNSVAASPRPQGRPVEINVVARRWEFVPNRIEVTRGDHVRLVVVSADGTHGFVCKKLGIKQDIPRGGEPVIIEFDASQAGEFRMQCFEYCGTGHSQMGGTVIVKEPNATDAKTGRAPGGPAPW